MDPFATSIAGVADLIGNGVNKVNPGAAAQNEGATGDEFDALSVDMTTEELLKLRDQYEMRYAPYEAKLKPRVDKIRNSYLGKRPDGAWLIDHDLPIAANLQFEAEETFLAAALAKNPDPVVYCDNTPEGDAVATSVKTMLQFHADQLVIRRKLTLMVRQWSMDLLGVLKPGWNSKINDVALDNRKIRDYIFDPDGYVDAYGDFSSWFGERIKVTAEQLTENFPLHKDYIELVVDGKLGTEVTYTEWWPNDDYCFITFKEKVLDKFKNPYFSYPQPIQDPVTGKQAIDPVSGEPQMTKPINHFAHPKKPGIFLSVFSLQEHPHDITSLVEQNIPNQNRISRRTEQIDANASAANNGYAFSEDNFNQETAKQAANARKRGNPILIPSGGPIDKAIFPLPAQNIPSGFFDELEISKNDLRSSWGTQGLTAEPPTPDTTARGMVLNQAHDNSRIGGGIGDSIEQVADNAFNWLAQLYAVFYDEKHFAAIMGNAKAVEYVTLSNQDMDRQLIISVSPDSMKPKDDITNLNLAQALYGEGAIGPKTLLTMVDFPNPDESAADGALWAVDKMAYIQLNFPEVFQALAQYQQQQAQQQMSNQAQGTAMNAQASGKPQGGGQQPPAQPPTEAQDPASASLAQVPLPPVSV